MLLLSQASPKVRYLDACWSADGERARAELAARPNLMNEIDDEDRRVINHAAWWYRPAAVRLMLELGFDPHVRGVHQSTVLDRACFHGYADIVQTLLGTTAILRSRSRTSSAARPSAPASMAR